MTEAVARITALETSVFTIETQTSDHDRISLLRIQSLVRNLRGRYGYLEIGSYLGGTLLPHLVDPSCQAVHSVDLRPPSQPDERGIVFPYDENSTARMREQLIAAVSPRALLRLTTWERDASDIPAQAYGRKFDLVLIDGEHTNVAAFSDFVSILPILERDACVVFHDANLVLDAIINVEHMLRYLGTPFMTMFLSDLVAVICLRGAADMARADFEPHALDRDAFTAWARRALRAEIAKNFHA